MPLRPWLKEDKRVVCYHGIFVFSNSHIVILLVGRIDNIKDNEERTCIRGRRHARIVFSWRDGCFDGE